MNPTSIIKNNYNDFQPIYRVPNIKIVLCGGSYRKLIVHFKTINLKKECLIPPPFIIYVRYINLCV